MTAPQRDLLQARELLLLPEVLLAGGPVRDHAVVVADGVFRAVGPAAELVEAHPELDPVHLDGHLLMPGFVDAHHHLTQSFGKALAFGEPSEIFRRIWVPLEQQLDPESAYVAAKLAALEALRGGFTTVAEAGTRARVDIGVVADAATDAGIRCVLGEVCFEPDDGERHLSRWDSAELVHPSLAIPIAEAAEHEVLHAVSRLCAEAGAVFQIHVNEHLASVERSLERHGRRPLEHLHDVGALGPQTLAAHATMLTPGELRLLADSGAAVSYNPVASGWKGNAVAPAALMAASGVRFGLGTDGTRGDGFRLTDAAELAQRLAFGLHNGDSSCGGGLTWLRHATAGGADAVGLGSVTGAVEAGRAADFLLVDLRVPELCPSWDLPWELVRLANRDQITAVVVAGRLRLWRGWPVDWDGRELLEEAAKTGREVVARAPLRKIHPLSTGCREEDA
ncbi:cytosine/adenosine deaminase-related metal-dependent hydrolase [Saccharopolyspora erythraea NRRL 2338]|uniref:Cytosine deaminase or related metal-dependent hydrolase n=2 Tax=Saccharopolyspora erythraea TaxID=1836 RepID=A4F7I2_SACEN|nr:amidohydrolase family protein [Saccharopolyspora erythraea]EQD84276.1 S-adenosylhomocysteine deaminase [Saccharopolyspora erythraea D]PFG93808.1 cytosine/adenosine deaminase-related metal-dependent hydrolase [Saccharopolyspora erythraea NRRL 2338]QRK90641.1 amidohydrolase family protein [Saccharopolyspora erythraea]CAM00006.1 cytosine deaminase or related metal-dependent hydrolase [Saccharopolyspora erythraea NRRL 2338]